MKHVNYTLKSLYHLVMICFMVTIVSMPALASNDDQRTIRGTVTASDGSGIPGVNIAIKDAAGGTITDIDGNYSLEVANENAVLVFSYVGFETQEMTVGSNSTINIELSEDVTALSEVVVTALGIKREEKSLGFSVGKVEGEEFNRVAQESFLTGMAGKVAGVTISQTGGPGSTTNVTIRGAYSLSTNNQPLFVVDGVPMSNDINNVGGFGDRNPVDYGNVISDLDPENIESVSVLKGPAASALYGTRAGNGVVLITTKKAKQGTGMRISVSSSNNFDIPYKYLDTQKKFAAGYFSYRPEDLGGGVLPSVSSGIGGGGPELNKGYFAVQWDSPLDANGNPIPTELVAHPNNVQDFLNDYAFTSTNAVSLSNAAENLSYRLGYTNMTHNGLIPNSDLNRHNLSLSASAKAHEKVTISTDVNFVNSYAKNRPAGDRGTNPLQWAYFTPIEADINKLRDYDIGQGNTILQVAPGGDNPWMLANDVNNGFNRYQLFGNVMATWEITPKLNLMGRIALDKVDQTEETKIGQGYSREANNGTYGINVTSYLESNMDALLTYTETFATDFSLTVSVGGNTRYSKGTGVSNSAQSRSGLVVPNLFNLSNITNTALEYSSYIREQAINSAYGLANLGWRESIFLDLTARYDRSSTLAKGYSYPSASLSIILNEFIEMGRSVDMLKLRGGYAKSGNDTDPYNLVSTYGNSGQWGDAIRLNVPSTKFNQDLENEKQTSIELGVEAKLFQNRIRFEGTAYTLDNVKQIFNVPLPTSTGFTNRIVNAGLVQSKGIEINLGGTPVKSGDFRVDVDVNFTKNETRVLELDEDIPFLRLWDEGRVRSYAYAKGALVNVDQFGNDVISDGLVGTLYSRKVRRVTDPNSPYYMYPLIPDAATDSEWEAASTYEKVGNANPKFLMGGQVTVAYKNFSLSATFDWRHGGQFVSQSYRYLTEDKVTNHWFENLNYPGVYDPENPGPSQELRDWVVANADKLLYPDKLYPVGGPTPEYGGFPENWSGVTVYDGVFSPGVVGTYDGDGNFILDHENLGNPGTTFLPYSVSFPWDIGLANMFDADYVKLREIALNYRFPKSIAQRIMLENIDISVYSRNIILWTKNTFNIDPERAYQPSGSQLYQGVERYNVLPWVMPVGFKVSLTL